MTKKNQKNMDVYDKWKNQWWKFYVLSSLVEVVNVVVLFKIHFIQLMGSLSWDSFYGVYGALVYLIIFYVIKLLDYKIICFC
jgi:hypothetical protein